MFLEDDTDENICANHRISITEKLRKKGLLEHFPDYLYSGNDNSSGIARPTDNVHLHIINRNPFALIKLRFLQNIEEADGLHSHIVKIYKYLKDKNQNVLIIEENVSHIHT